MEEESQALIRDATEHCVLLNQQITPQILQISFKIQTRTTNCATTLSRKWLLITVDCSNRTAAQCWWQHTHAKANGLDLEPTAVPPATSLLELPSLGAHVRLGVAVWHTRSLAKVSHCLTGILGTPQEDLQKASINNVSLSSSKRKHK
jgi:hypothetical protein